MARRAAEVSLGPQAVVSAGASSGRGGRCRSWSAPGSQPAPATAAKRGVLFDGTAVGGLSGNAIFELVMYVGVGARRARLLKARARQVVYSDFLTLVRGGAVRSARIDEDNARVYFELRRSTPEPDVAAGADSRTRQQGPRLEAACMAWLASCRAPALAQRARAQARRRPRQGPAARPLPRQNPAVQPLTR